MTRQRVPNAELYRDTARQNLLTNGGFEIWQRGNGPFTGYGVYTADRWVTTGNPGDTISVSRNTANTDGGGACAAVTFTKGTGVTGLAQYPAGVSGGVENLSLLGRTVTLSVRVRTSTANAVRIGVYSGSAHTYSAYHPGGDTYQTLTVTATLGVTGGSLGMCAVWFDVSCTAYVDNAMLVIGNVAADYAPLHPADDLARCMRYYEASVDRLPATGICINATIGNVSYHYKQVKGGTPTVTFPGGASAYYCGGTWGNAPCSAITAEAFTSSAYVTMTTAGGMVAGQACYYYAASGAAVISVEWNP